MQGVTNPCSVFVPHDCEVENNSRKVQRDLVCRWLVSVDSVTL